jgi:parallel beta-helix repeat protein
VSPTGSDTGPGTFEQPYRSIQRAVDAIDGPGDRVLVMPGEYRSNSTYTYDAIVIEGKNGLPGQEIVIRGFDLNNRPVIINRSNGFRIVDSSYLILEGFEITDTINSGIALDLSNNIVVRNNYIHFGFTGLCQPGEGLPQCKADGSGIGNPKGRKDNLGNYLLEHDGKQNPGIYLCKSWENRVAENVVEYADEGIYVGSAGEISAGTCSTNDTPRTWASGNIIENNLVNTTLNEGIELKPDAIRTVVRDNLLKNTAGVEIGGIEVRSAYNEIFGNVIFGDNQFSKTGIRLVDESTCTTPPNDEFGNSMRIYPDPTGFLCAFQNSVHHNFIYYSQGSDYVPAINNHAKSAGNTIDHNTIVGGNDFGIISDAVSSSITNNLIIGSRGTKRALLNQAVASRPLISDFNAFYPNRNSTGSCNESIAGVTVACENGLNSTYEVNSIFMASDPVGSLQPARSPIKIDAECSALSLSQLPVQSLKNTIIACSHPLTNEFGLQIVNQASDGANIGAGQGTG